jgi:hypothetical protein
MRKSSRQLAWIAVVTLATLPFAGCKLAAARQVSPSGPFIVAVADGTTLLPVARFTGSRWVNTWPAPGDRDDPVPALADIPTAWLGQQVPSAWTLSTADGRRWPLRVVGTTRERGGCSAAVKLTLEGAQVPEGVALDTDRLVTPVAALGRGSPEWQNLEPAVIAVFRSSQQQLVDDRLRRYRNDSDDARILRQVLSPDRLANAPVTIDHLYRERDEPVIYFEGHIVATADLWQLQGFRVTGWLAKDIAGHWRPLHLTGDLITSESNGPGSELRIPLGALRLDDKVLWVSAVIGYEASGFVIDEVMPTGIRQIIATSPEGC